MQAAIDAHLAQVECACDFLSLDTLQSTIKGHKKGPHGEVSLNWSLRFELANQANEQFSSTTANSRKIKIFLSIHGFPVMRKSTLHWDLKRQFLFHKAGMHSSPLCPADQCFQQEVGALAGGGLATADFPRFTSTCPSRAQQVLCRSDSNLAIVLSQLIQQRLKQVRNAKTGVSRFPSSRI